MEAVQTRTKSPNCRHLSTSVKKTTNSVTCAANSDSLKWFSCSYSTVPIDADQEHRASSGVVLGLSGAL